MIKFLAAQEAHQYKSITSFHRKVWSKPFDIHLHRMYNVQILSCFSSTA